MVTAAHCLYDNQEKETLPDDSFSVMLGLHDRSKVYEATRYKKLGKQTHYVNFPGKSFVF